MVTTLLSFEALLVNSPGAIAITGGQFSNASVSVVIDSIECIGNESGLLNCYYVTESNETARECDPEGIAAVTCQG